MRTAALELGYRHNLGASNLRRGSQTAAIGLLVQDLSNDFLRGPAPRGRGPGAGAWGRRDVGLARRRARAGARPRGGAGEPAQRRVDPHAVHVGPVLISRQRSKPASTWSWSTGVPRHLLDSVTVDNAGGAASAADHLLRHGHRRIGGLFDDLRITTAPERLAGFMNSMARGSVAPDTHVVATGLRTEVDGTAAVLAMLELPDPPTAFFCGRNVLTMGAVRALQQAGLEHEVAVVGFDDFSGADLLQPRVTVVRQDAVLEGQTAVDLLLARMDGLIDPPRSLVLPTELIVRGSGEIRGPYGVPP